MRTIDIWEDRTSEPGETSLVVSLSVDGIDDRTLASFAQSDIVDAYEYAKERSRMTGYPVYRVGKKGRREFVYQAK